MSDLRVDHIIYVVDDLDGAAAWFRNELGLGSVVGGRHHGWGTANRIVPLGGEYVELVAVADPNEAAASDFGRPVMKTAASGGGLAGWAVATDDLHSIARRLNLAVTRGARTRPDGSVLRWRLAGVGQALAAPSLPFFIQWDAPAKLHPGAAAADHDKRPCGIAWLELTVEKETLHSWLGDSNLPVRITDGPPSLAAVAISTAVGELVLR